MNIPSQPAQVYASQGWLSMPDWLGYGIAKGPTGVFLPFEEAREFARKLGLKSRKQWLLWKRGNRPANIPANPQTMYASAGWLSWADWLGYGKGQVHKTVLSQCFLPFEEARSYVWGLRLQNIGQWKEWSRTKRPPNIPSLPRIHYAADGWLSWRDWLGYGKGLGPVGEFLPFEEARSFVRKQRIPNSKQWHRWSKEHRPLSIPSHPECVYATKGWLSMSDWLGYEEGSKSLLRPVQIKKPKPTLQEPRERESMEHCAERKAPEDHSD